MYKKSGYFWKTDTLNFSRVLGKVCHKPLWLVQNVRLPDREGLWQIAIENGQFGAITPMDETHSESYEVLRYPAADLPFHRLLSRIFTSDTTQRRASHWNQSGTLFEGLNAGRARRRSAMKISARMEKNAEVAKCQRDPVLSAPRGCLRPDAYRPEGDAEVKQEVAR